MKLFDSERPRRWLFCFGHPDDEIAVGAFIQSLTSSGSEVHMAWTHHNARRRQEAERAAVELLSVPIENLNFLGCPDGMAASRLAELAPMYQSIVERIAPDRVVVTAFEQGHLDHDATNYLVNGAFAGPVLEFPLYHTYGRKLQVLNRFSSPDGQEVSLLSEGQQQLKRTLARRYPSQNIYRILWCNEALGWLARRPRRLAATERMRLQVHTDFRTPNHPPHLRRLVETTVNWRTWLGALDAFEGATLDWRTRITMDAARPVSR